MKQLERLLFLQGNRCFFCEQAIPAGEASVEHLVASANGGANADDNCVVCCKAVNAALGSLSVKAKLRAVLNQRGPFVCPHRHEAASTDAKQINRDEGMAVRLAVVIADLQKRGAARPRRVLTLKNTIAALFRKKLLEEELEALVGALASAGYVAIADSKVTYALPQAGA